MNESNSTTKHRRVRSIAGLVSIVRIVAGILFFRDVIRSHWPLRMSTPVDAQKAPASVSLVDGVANAIAVEPAVVKQLGIRTGAAVEAEAKRLIEDKTESLTELTQQWARVEIRASIAGTILEQNVAVGDLVSPSDDLFQITDLTRLRVLAYAYEEDLPRLDASHHGNREWAISIPADPSAPPTQGVIDQIGKIIDPTQHTALVMGWVANPDGRLRAGQFVSASVQFPPPGNEVLVPATAVIEKGGDSLIFVKVQDDPVFTRRCVVVSRQVGDQVCILVEPPPSDNPGSPTGLEPNEEVVISGAVELQQSLTDLQASQAGASASASRILLTPQLGSQIDP